jgi:hypothetical protein
MVEAQNENKCKGSNSSLCCDNYVGTQREGPVQSHPMAWDQNLNAWDLGPFLSSFPKLQIHLQKPMNCGEVMKGKCVTCIELQYTQDMKHRNR